MRRLRRLLFGLVLFAPLALSGPTDGDTVFVGTITDTECGPDHAPMIAKGGMGTTARECTYRCVEKGATFGFVDADQKKFFQLDDQDAPRPYAGENVRIEGTLQGDTIRVRSIARAD